jgi:undecaprenyl-diphosphatase
VLTRLGTFGLGWIAAALVAAVVLRRAEVALLTAAAVVVADTTASLIKQAVERPRPFVPFPDPEPLVGTGSGYAFPSGHAATSFAAATVLARAAPRLTPVLVVLAVAVAWSRVYVGVHYPGDVLAGALLGLAVGATLVLVAGRAVAPARAAARALPQPGGGRRRSRRAPPPG